jgi:hypothetical protein
LCKEQKPPLEEAPEEDEEETAPLEDEDETAPLEDEDETAPLELEEEVTQLGPVQLPRASQQRATTP